MPVTIKVMLNLGPKSNYDLMLEEEEKLQLRVAARNRALRLRTQMMGTRPEQAAEQAMLTAGEDARPGTTRGVPATRAQEGLHSGPFSPGTPSGGQAQRPSAETEQARQSES